MQTILGSEKLHSISTLVGKRVGLVSNPASVDHSYQHISDRIATNKDFTLATIFGPQHGFHADVQDNMVETAHAHHPRFGVPIYSLYSDTREPTQEMFDGIDSLLIDLQDVGTRVYTYIYTMANCLRIAKRFGIRVVVCDRPNPIGGLAVEGPVLDSNFCSFVGQFPIPLRHGMTIGELALMFNEHFEIGATLEVVPLTGWSRDMYQNDTDVPWIIPSPNLPTLDSAIVYSGTVLVEGTLLSEGRGTTKPFELIGAPEIDPDALTFALNKLRLPGVHFRPINFEPTFQKHAGRQCGGCQIHVTSPKIFQPVLSGIAVIQSCRRSLGDQFKWKEPPYEYEYEKLPIDILSGSSTLRSQIETDTSAAEISASWDAELEAFRKIRADFLLY